MSDKRFNNRIKANEVEDFFKSYGQHKDFVMIDLRPARDLREGTIPQSINMDFDEFDEEYIIDNFSKDKIYLFFCATAMRSCVIAEMFEEAGFPEVYFLEKGYRSWKNVFGI